MWGCSCDLCDVEVTTMMEPARALRNSCIPNALCPYEGLAISVVTAGGFAGRLAVPTFKTMARRLLPKDLVSLRRD